VVMNYHTLSYIIASQVAHLCSPGPPRRGPRDLREHRLRSGDLRSRQRTPSMCHARTYCRVAGPSESMRRRHLVRAGNV
jgi:hypothetical protein